MPACYRIERVIVIQSWVAPLHGENQAGAITRKSNCEGMTMLSRAKFLRMAGLAATALVISPEAMPKSNDGIVRVKSSYNFQETIARLKKDIAAKGIRFFSE